MNLARVLAQTAHQKAELDPVLMELAIGPTLF
jgi:hypothetical protein